MAYVSCLDLLNTQCVYNVYNIETTGGRLAPGPESIAVEDGYRAGLAAPQGSTTRSNPMAAFQVPVPLSLCAGAVNPIHFWSKYGPDSVEMLPAEV